MSILGRKFEKSRFFGFEGKSLEETIFLQALSISCISVMLIALNTALHGMIYPLFVFNVFCLLILCFFNYLARYKGLYKQITMPFLIAILLLISFSWFISGGYRGPSGYFLMAILVLNFAIFNSKQRFIYSALVVLSVVVLYTIEYINPTLTTIIPFKIDIIGHGIILIICVVTTYAIVVKIKNSYDRDREKVIEMNARLSEQKVEIELKNKELHAHSEKLKNEVEQQTKQLASLNADLIEKNTSLEQFTYILSHNVRTPISHLKSLFGLLPDDYPTDTMTKEVLIRMKASAFKLEDIILDLSKIVNVSKDTKELIETVSIRKQLKLALNTLENQIKATNAEIDITLVDDVEIKGINAYVQSIFYNLINNALKYASPERKPLIVITVQEEEGILIRISDNGIGIDMAVAKDKIFQLYQRFNADKPGKGFGLFLIKTQVNAMGGQIYVESEVGVGTTFSIHI